MTEKLKTLMHAQADSVDFEAPDVDALTRSGDRRLRTRRLTLVGGLAAAAVGAVAVLPAALPDGGRGTDPADTTGSAPAPLTWVEGSTLHLGDRAVPLDFLPRAYVRTGEGYVFSDREGRVWSWVDGDAKEVGRTDATRPHLVSDEESDLAGWFDPAEGSYAVLDQRPNGSVRYHPAPPLGEPEDFVGIDAGTAYWTAASGPVAFDLDTGRSTPLEVGGTVADVEDDLLAVRTDAGISIRTVAGKELRVLDGFYGELGSFSSDARYFTNDADVPQVYDVAAGEQVEVPIGTREFASGYEWLDGRTLALIASAEASDDSRVQLVRCTVPDGSCETVATLMTFDEAVDVLSLPVGTPIDG